MKNIKHYPRAVSAVVIIILATLAVFYINSSSSDTADIQRQLLPEVTQKPADKADTHQAKPSIDIKINNQDETLSVDKGQAITLSWATSGLTSCFSSSDFDDQSWPNNEPQALNGEQEIIPRFSHVFTLRCVSDKNPLETFEDSISLKLVQSQGSEAQAGTSPNINVPVTATTGSPDLLILLMIAAIVVGPVYGTLVYYNA